MSGVGERTGPRRAVLAVALVAVMVGSVVTAGVAFVQPASAAPQTLSSCGTIDESGKYVLDSDIDAGGETCFTITASDVTLDGNGHTITGDGGNDRAFAVFVDGRSSSVSNVTVTDMTVTRWFNGVTVRSADEVTVSDVTAIDDMYYGYWVVNAEGFVLEDSVAREHTRGEGEGVSILKSQNLLLDNVSIVDNQYGLHIDNGARDIRIVDSTISGNSDWGYYMRGYNDGSQPANVTATNLTLGDAVVDIEASQNVVLEGTDSLPTAPDGRTVGAPLRTSTAGGSAASALNLTVHYGDAEGVNESTLGLWQYDDSWTAAPPDTVDADANTVTSPIDFTSDGTIYLSVVGENATDGGESEPEPEPASFEVSELDAPATVTLGETATVSATVTNTGGSASTQTVEARVDMDGDGTLETTVATRSVSLDPGESRTATVEIPVDGVDPGTYTYGVSTDDDSTTAEVTVEASEPEPEPANFEVSSLDAPATVTQGETVPVTATVTNTGGSESTQTVELRIDLNGDGTPEAIGVNESVTLAANASQQVTFDVPTDGVDAGTYTHGVFTANDSATAELTVEAAEPEPEPPEEPEEVYYQVDLVAGEPIENLSADTLYAQQDRLVRWALGSTDEGVTERGNAWASEEIRDSIESVGVVERNGDTATITFTIAEDSEDVRMSFVSYEKPTAGFSPETADQQELFDATTETFGPGEHTITVTLPESTTDDSDAGNETAALTGAVPTAPPA